MIASKDPHHLVSPTEVEAYALHWVGHMSDGVGATSGIAPGAVLSANADELWLKGNRGDFHIPRNAVVKISRGRFYPWFFRGLQIRHRIAGYPAELQFLPLEVGARGILAQLKALGFPTA
jgi:hypothetical protein